MQIVPASPHLAATIRAMISTQMAGELLKRETALDDDLAVVCALARAGFGDPSIRKLRRRAVRLARSINAYNADAY